MAPPSKQRPTLAQSLALFIPGIVLVVISAGQVATAFGNTTGDMPLLPMLALCLGAVLFAVGGMMLLVVMVRPHFGKRPADTLADRVAESKRQP